MNDTLTIRLDQSLAAALEAEARLKGLSKGQIVRSALEKELHRESKFKVMHKFFGTVHGPKDLSYNKSYRKSWKKPTL